jgi:hypothetical protein
MSQKELNLCNPPPAEWQSLAQVTLDLLIAQFLEIHPLHKPAEYGYRASFLWQAWLTI